MHMAIESECFASLGLIARVLAEAAGRTGFV